MRGSDIFASIYNCSGGSFRLDKESRIYWVLKFLLKFLKGKKVFDHCLLFTAYADTSTFFCGDIDSVKNLINIFQKIL